MPQHSLFRRVPPFSSCLSIPPPLLQLLGIDRQKLTFRYQGLEQHLTGVEETRVIHALLA